MKVHAGMCCDLSISSNYSLRLRHRNRFPPWVDDIECATFVFATPTKSIKPTRLCTLCSRRLGFVVPHNAYLARSRQGVILSSVERGGLNSSCRSAALCGPPNYRDSHRLLCKVRPNKTIAFSSKNRVCRPYLSVILRVFHRS